MSDQMLRQKAINGTKSNSPLTIFTDRDFYSQTEFIWLNAIINGDYSSTSKIFFIDLVDPSTRQAVLRKKFKITSNRAAGYVYVADSIQPGTYRLIAYTDNYISGKSAELFNGSVIIIDSQKKWKAKVINQLNGRDSARLSIRVLNENDRFVKGMKIFFQLQSTTAIYAKGEAVIDENSEFRISVPFSNLYRRLFLLMSARDARDIKNLVVPLNVNSNKLIVDIYAVDGGPVEGYEAAFMYIIRDINGKPSRERFQIKYGDGFICASPNSHGYGYFKASVNRKLNFSAEAENKTLLIETGRQPAVSSRAVRMQMYPVLYGDSLRFELLGTGIQNMHAFVHNANEMFYRVDVKDVSKTTAVTIDTKFLSYGLHAVSIYDSAGNFMTRKYFYKRPRYGELIKINLAAEVFHVGDSIPVNLSAIITVEPSLLTVSVASKRLLFSADTGQFSESLSNVSKSEYLNIHPMAGDGEIEALMYLMTETSIPEKSKFQFDSIGCDSGRISFRSANRPKKLPFPPVLLFNNASAHWIKTDSMGLFAIADDLLVTSSPKKPYLLLTSFRDKFVLNYNNTCLYRQQQVDSIITNEVYNEQTEIPEINEALLKIGNLDPVIVKAKLPDYEKKFVGEDCDNWVCQMNVLNCINHPRGTLPIKGKVYWYQDRQSRDEKTYLVLYAGCKESFLTVEPIHDAQTLKATHSGTEGTLYWNANVSLDQAGKFNFVVPAGQVPGEYVITAKGMIGDTVVETKKIIRVIK